MTPYASSWVGISFLRTAPLGPHMSWGELTTLGSTSRSEFIPEALWLSKRARPWQRAAAPPSTGWNPPEIPSQRFPVSSYSPASSCLLQLSPALSWAEEHGVIYWEERLHAAAPKSLPRSTFSGIRSELIHTTVSRCNMHKKSNSPTNMCNDANPKISPQFLRSHLWHSAQRREVTLPSHVWPLLVAWMAVALVDIRLHELGATWISSFPKTHKRPWWSDLSSGFQCSGIPLDYNKRTHSFLISITF